jgi:hypothetical protein
MTKRSYKYLPGERQAEREIDAFLARVNPPSTVSILDELRGMRP